MRRKLLWIMVLTALTAVLALGCDSSDGGNSGITDGDNDAEDSESDSIVDGDEQEAPCIPDCEGKECGFDGCDGSCGTCNQPPAATCITTTTLRVYNNSGTCTANYCEYDYTDNPCSDGCVDGVCQGCEPNCENKQCGDDGCGGSCGLCNQPPAPTCITPFTLRTYNGTGNCTEGTCDYGYTDTSCEHGCSDGICQGCVIDCEGKECGSDGCGGNCGSCNNPPEPMCISGDPEVLRLYDRAGSCDMGLCTYEFTDIDCQFECTDGECQECAPQCEGKECGPDGCDGFCGACNQPPTPVCESDTTLRVFEPTGMCTEAGICEYDSSLVSCEFGCADNECSGCTPDCEGRVCGSDGCGGTCGDCDWNNEGCNAAGLCYCLENHVSCNDMCCPAGDVCTEGACCTPAGSCPAEVECGGWTDPCGVDHVCDPCLNGYSCVENNCLCLDGKTECNEVCCPSAGHVCFNNECCLPNCEGKECGGDGCGGSCGACSENESCDADGACVCTYLECEGVCCADGQACHEGVCCTPNCEGKECGSDGCGGSCGDCEENEECGVDGLCICPNEVCNDICCPAGDACFENACCTPACDGLECGDDSCGGTCGDCGEGYDCTENLCVCPTPRVECNTVCCPTDDVCFEDACCTPLAACDPGEAECGTWADACGVEHDCGTCPTAGDVCVENICCTPAAVCDPGEAECGIWADSCGVEHDCGTCPTGGDVCVANICCTPDCAGKACGSDGCDGSCGTCPAGQVCDGTGQCVAE